MTTSPALQVSFEELCQSLNSNQALVLELVECSIVVPVTGAQPPEWLFDVMAISVAQKALRLHHDLEIELAGVALVLNLLDELDQLRSENDRLKQRLGRFLQAEL